MIHKFYNGRVILGGSIADGVAVYTKGDRIIAITADEREFDVAHDAKGMYISPGFIDIHVHGGGGGDFADCTEESFLAAAELHAKYGTTTLLPTASAAPAEEYIGMLDIIKKMDTVNTKGAYMPGIHYEGSFLSAEQAGGQQLKYIRMPDKAEYEKILSYSDRILRWSAAPELPGTEEFARALREHNVLPAIAHSNAEYDEVVRAFDMGFTLVTHLYSCCSTVHRKNAYRYAGVVEAAYAIDGMDVEIIADGSHLPASLLKLVYKLKGVDRIALITDGMRGAGFPDGTEVIDGSLKNGIPVIIEDGVAKLMSREAFAGSVCTTNRLVRNMMKLADVPLLHAVQMATVNPARMVNLRDRGMIREGAFADILIFDNDINVKLTMVNGNIVFSDDDE